MRSKYKYYDEDHLGYEADDYPEDKPATCVRRTLRSDVLGSGALREEARELWRVAVVSRLNFHAVAGEEDLEATQYEQVEDNANSAVKGNIDKVPVGREGEGGRGGEG
jgi:hypothetical protein